jgi:hypothetical protein
MRAMTCRGAVLTVIPGLVLLGACSSPGGTAEPPTVPRTPTSTAVPVDYVAGELDVEGDFSANLAAGNHAVGGPCITPAGYSDIADGGQVAVLDAAGKTVGLGSLTSTGMHIADGSTSLADTYCGFTFEVRDVPTGAGFYSIVVGHRDPMRETEADLFGSYLSLTLGDVPS